jgi:hypothetical protein
VNFVNQWCRGMYVHSTRFDEATSCIALDHILFVVLCRSCRNTGHRTCFRCRKQRTLHTMGWPKLFYPPLYLYYYIAYHRPIASTMRIPDRGKHSVAHRSTHRSTSWYRTYLKRLRQKCGDGDATRDISADAGSEKRKVREKGRAASTQ